ncbi:MAG: thioredoxin domain-containing protein [Ignavibacteriae bacterium]|nr:thioredoxin domain-containing protein [Ignavibacteriota bacterium]
MNEGKKPNRLIHEKSPYLLQHAFNPVDWYPWGPEAFQKARMEDKPIFLSVGYSTCYWCHVMEREVFEDPEIAKLMNEKLVSIKVDREERPDVDRVYMTAVQAMTGSGGWPMSVFLTPDLKPFYGATYIPPRAQYGRPGFVDVVNRISEIWKTDRSKVFESSQQITEYLKQAGGTGASATVTDSVLHLAYNRYAQGYDAVHGGFGGAPKFPRPVSLNFLLRYYSRTGREQALQMSLHTLREMANGGMYDHIGGGFHRYSVDGEWRVPHFEKMLYDQAQLVTSYLEAYQITKDERFAEIARDVLAYVLRNLTDKQGGFYSAEDAESALDPSKPEEKEEGTFYIWSKSEIDHLLGKDAELFNYYYGVQDAGNALNDPMNVFSGKNILYVAHPIEDVAVKFLKTPAEIKNLLKQSTQKLFFEREKRPRPHLDDKIITAWNGLMISAFAKAYQVLDDPAYLQAAQRANTFIISKLYDTKSKKLLRRYRDGEARFDGNLQDYTFLVMGLLDLYEASFEIQWLEHAIALTKKQIEIFWDPIDGGFFDTPGNDPSILVRMKEDYDGAEPTGNSIAAVNLLRLSQMTDNNDWRRMAEKTITAFGSRLKQIPDALSQMLVAVDWHLSTPKEIIVAGKKDSPDTKALLREVHSRFIPNKVLLLADGGDAQKKLTSYLSFIEGMIMLDEKATAYICENYACQLPTSDRSVVAKLLSK